ncbi:calpain-B-like [Uloborus diversus]|uniref:calpain-B-like n=1 Tax=Uloborus diversus TaxID=327109 RepID=UPI00240A8836|nr:calpain-B-like [Uloborus diversus]
MAAAPPQLKHGSKGNERNSAPMATNHRIFGSKDLTSTSLFLMGCGASVDGDSDSQASLEEWEKVQPPIRRSATPEISDVDSDDGMGYHKNDKDMRASGFQQGASIAIVDDIAYPTAAREVSSMTNASEEESLFLDNDFPPSESTLYHSKRTRDPQIVWLRPHELTLKPQLLVDGVSRHDIVQGILADCWFLSSCAAVAQRPDLMEKVIPPNQPLSGENYKGIVTFRFWRFGNWITVYVDDLLPTKKRKLIFSRSSEPREFWVSLLEKAYAKLHGSYEALEGGQSMDALVDLTGGLAEMYVLETAPPHLYHYLLQASSNGAFITCSRKGDWTESRKADANGLVSGHAYTISAVATVKLSTGSEACLIRIRNPWGNDTEWNGQWNDSDMNWHNVDSNTKQSIDYAKRGDGEFWMSYHDFCREFEEVTICSLTPDLGYSSFKHTTADGPQLATFTKFIYGRWEEGKSCGGSRNNLVSFATNPQFLLSLSAKNNRVPERKCNVVIALMQLRRRCVRHPKRKMLQIAFVIFRVKEPSRLNLEKFLHTEEVGNSGPYVNYREVFGRFELHPGHYVVVPATFEPNSPGSFYIRIYADAQIILREA